MNTHLDKKQEDKTSMPQKSSGKASFQLVDNRSEHTAQRKLQDLADNSTQAKKTAQLQKVTTKSANAPVQMVLKDPAQAGQEAALIRQYHTAEDNGDAIGFNNSISDQRRAVTYYGTAKRLRIQVEHMHNGAADPNHRQAITVLNGKIRARNAKIAGLEEQKRSGRKPKRPALNRGGKKRF